ncbi:MAG: hypothetical protein SangKO_047020 [Sandaracinaceae bacterium]
MGSSAPRSRATPVYTTCSGRAWSTTPGAIASPAGARGTTRALFHLSKGDWAWTTETPEAGATPPPINDHGVYGRFQNAPEYDVFILAVTVDGPVLMYEPVDWSP